MSGELYDRLVRQLEHDHDRGNITDDELQEGLEEVDREYQLAEAWHEYRSDMDRF